MSGLNAPGLDRTLMNRGSNWLGTLRDDGKNLNMYMTHGIAARIVDLPADDCTSRGLTIEGDNEGIIVAELDRLRWTTHGADAMRWSRLFGGAMIVLITDDSNDLTEPLNVNNIGQIHELRVVDVTMVSMTGEYYSDPVMPNFGMPVTYMVQTANKAANYEVHESRCIPIGGLPVPGFVKRTLNVPWRGRSALQGSYEDLLRYISCAQWMERMMERKQQTVFSMKGMSTLLQQTYDKASGTSMGASIIGQRVNLADMSRSLLNSIAIDEEDKFEVKDLNLSGVPEVFNVLQMAISADSGMPVTVLFGRAPAGHNATGQSDSENYYGMIGQLQNNYLLPALERLVPLIQLQKTYGGKRFDTKVMFNPMWLPTDEQQSKAKMDAAQAKLFEAQAVQIYEEIGALAAPQVTEWLTNNGDFDLAADLIENKLAPAQQALSAETQNNSE